jgi:hypothetical protein
LALSPEGERNQLPDGNSALQIQSGGSNLDRFSGDLTVPIRDTTLVVLEYIQLLGNQYFNLVYECMAQDVI